MQDQERKFTVTVSKEGLHMTYDGSEEKIPITKRQFEKMLKNDMFSESHLTINPGHVGEWFTRQIEGYISEYEKGNSPYGERVILKPIEINETMNGETVDLQCVWQCFKESGEYLQDATINIKELSGPIVRAAIMAGLSVAEVIQTILQLNMSGASATEDDERPLETIFKEMQKARKDE